MEFFSVYKMANFYVRKLQLGTQISVFSICNDCTILLLF